MFKLSERKTERKRKEKVSKAAEKANDANGDIVTVNDAQKGFRNFKSCSIAISFQTFNQVRYYFFWLTL